MSQIPTASSNRDWWKNLPCPLHPSWKLCDISELDLQKLKKNVDTDENDVMVVELAIYRAFLEFPRGSFYNIYNKGRDNPTEALRYLGIAEEYVSTKFRTNVDAVIGYGIVIKTFNLWIREDDSTESLLKDFISQKDSHPNHESYINIVHAYILSRLGPRWRDMASSLYESALATFPNNWEWLFGKALMIGREARQIGYETSWKDQGVRDKFQIEKDILKRILDLNPGFNLARAFYGQVLFSLGEKGSGDEISRALEKEPNNCSIAMVAVRYHRRNGEYSSAEAILKRLLETYKTAEVNFQLGFLYYSQASSIPKPPISERLRLWRAALEYFDEGVKLDLCHYPCYTRRAEMLALLGETERSHDFFEELFKHVYKDKPYLSKSEMQSIHTALEMRLPLDKQQVFTTKEVIELSHRYITLAIEEGFVTTNGLNDSVFVTRKIERRLEKLKEMSNVREKYNLLATLKLADANRRLGKFEEAEQLYMKMFTQVAAVEHKEEILWGLGKCYFGQGFNDKVNSMARRLERVDTNHMAVRLQNVVENQLKVQELYAGVYLRLAKDELTIEEGLRVDDKPCRSSLLENLERAIERGSLEACYLFLTKLPVLHHDFFSLELRVSEVLAKILLTLGNEQVRNFHTQFKVILTGGSEIIHDETAKRNLIKEKLNNLLRYDAIIKEHTCSEEVEKEYKQLELLRQARIEFELGLVKRKEGENWNSECKEKLTEVLQIARVVLDHIVHIYQTLVLERPPGRSLFAIHFDWNKAKIDKNMAKEKLQKWIGITFPGYNIPESTFNIILEVQPMYDKDNLWLAALGSFNSTVKHKSYVGEETFDLELKEANWIRLKSEDIVRKSCKEVERLVLYFLSLFKTLQDERGQVLDQLGERK